MAQALGDAPADTGSYIDVGELPPGTGPAYVVSTLGLMDYDPATCRIRLKAVHPGVTTAEIVKNTGFELVIPSNIGVNDPPSATELRLLREQIDPEKLYT